MIKNVEIVRKINAGGLQPLSSYATVLPLVQEAPKFTKKHGSYTGSPK